MAISPVYSFVNAMLYKNTYDSASTPPFTKDATTGNFKGELIGYRTNVTTLTVDHTVSRQYSLASKTPAVFIPMRMESRATLDFIPTSLTALGLFADLSSGSLTVPHDNLLLELDAKLYGIEAFVPRRVEFSVREGDVASVRVDGVFRQIYDLTGTPILESGTLGSPLSFSNITLTFNGVNYTVRELTATINTGHSVDYSLGDRRFAVVWQGRQEIELSFVVYGYDVSINDFMTNVGVSTTGTGIPVGGITATINNGTEILTFNDVVINDVGIPVRVGELIMVNVRAFAGSVTLPTTATA